MKIGIQTPGSTDNSNWYHSFQAAFWAEYSRKFRKWSKWLQISGFSGNFNRIRYFWDVLACRWEVQLHHWIPMINVPCWYRLQKSKWKSRESWFYAVLCLMMLVMTFILFLQWIQRLFRNSGKSDRSQIKTFRWVNHKQMKQSLRLLRVSPF